MNVIKTTLALATAAAFAAPVMAQDAVTVYGKVNLAVESADMYEDRTLGIYNAASRLGVKGGAELADGLSVIYQAEFEVNVDDKKGDAFGKRNQFIGLQGNFGQVLIGRNDTMVKQSQGKVDLFGDLAGDIKGLFKGENRLGETLTYVSPSFSNIKLGMTLALEDGDKQDDNGYSLAAMYGDKKLKKSPIYASLAIDSEVAGYDIIRATVQGKVSDFVLGAMYQTQEKVAGGDDESGFMVNAAYKMDAMTVKAQYQDLEDLNSMSLGVDYKLAKPTKVYAYYTSTDKGDADYIGFGMEHKF